MNIKQSFFTGLALSALCVAASGQLKADNISNQPDPTKHHHYANPDGKSEFADPDNVMHGHEPNPKFNRLAKPIPAWLSQSGYWGPACASSNANAVGDLYHSASQREAQPVLGYENAQAHPSRFGASSKGALTVIAH